MPKESFGSGEVVVFPVKRYRRNIDTVSIPFIVFDFTSKPSVNQSSHIVSWHQNDYYYRRAYSKCKKNGTGHILTTHRAFCPVTPRQVFAVWMLIVALQWLPRLVWSIRPGLLCTRPAKHHPRKTFGRGSHDTRGACASIRLSIVRQSSSFAHQGAPPRYRCRLLAGMQDGSFAHPPWRPVLGTGTLVAT